MNKGIRNWYLRPRPFELQEKGKIYEQIGARVYKKWVPTSGEVITRLRGINRLKIAETGSRRKALENHEKITQKWEWRHLISAIFLALWGIGAGTVLGVEHFYTSFIINLFVNLYPIIVQRYNRVRITLLLNKMGS